MRLYVAAHTLTVAIAKVRSLAVMSYFLELVSTFSNTANARADTDGRYSNIIARIPDTAPAIEMGAVPLLFPWSGNMYDTSLHFADFS